MMPKRRPGEKLPALHSDSTAGPPQASSPLPRDIVWPTGKIQEQKAVSFDGGNY